MAATEYALAERLSRVVADGGLAEGAGTRASARFMTVLSEGFAVHAAAGAERDDLQAVATSHSGRSRRSARLVGIRGQRSTVRSCSVAIVRNIAAFALN
ncbi:hypothetical protein F3087_11230 [Nocardia colli]|uniref:Uncharacterized protein n=1 Tax=Nocardia colli TaxID=2545717 RepID=A0A5N0ENB9_9NOCA|nr:hypothetical protein [Nocardia colli]KAA8889485.1 hypothetical protein F3087_11230 [Nocardia colli]